MKIFIEKEHKIFNKDFDGKARDLLKKLKINLETIIILKNDELVTEDENLINSDEIKIISVVSGG